MLALSLQAVFCLFLFLLFGMSYILLLLLRARHDTLSKLETEIDKPLDFVFIWLGFRLCFLCAVPVVSEVKIYSGVLIFVSPLVFEFPWRLFLSRN